MPTYIDLPDACGLCLTPAAAAGCGPSDFHTVTRAYEFSQNPRFQSPNLFLPGFNTGLPGIAGLRIDPSFNSTNWMTIASGAGGGVGMYGYYHTPKKPPFPTSNGASGDAIVFAQEFSTYWSIKTPYYYNVLKGSSTVDFPPIGYTESPAFPDVYFTYIDLFFHLDKTSDANVYSGYLDPLYGLSIYDGASHNLVLTGSRLWTFGPKSWSDIVTEGTAVLSEWFTDGHRVPFSEYLSLDFPEYATFYCSNS